MRPHAVSDPDGWCQAFLAVLPVDHAAIATLGDPFEVAVLAASDPTAASLTQLQLDRGIGPCWDATATRRPVLVPDLAAAASWRDLLSTGHATTAIGSAYALPLIVGRLIIGAVGLYATGTDVLDDRDITAGQAPATRVGLHVLHRALENRDGPDAPGAASRRVVHQATGMVMAQVRVSAEDALLLIRGRAFTDGTTVEDLATAIVDRTITFDDDDGVA